MLHLVTAKKESFCAYLNTPLTCKECKKTTLKIKNKNDTDGAARSYRSVWSHASRRSTPFMSRGAGDSDPTAVRFTPSSPTPSPRGLARSGVFEG